MAQKFSLILRAFLTVLVVTSHKVFCLSCVTNNFPDGKFSRPQLMIFAFRFAQTKILLRFHKAKNLP